MKQINKTSSNGLMRVFTSTIRASVPVAGGDQAVQKTFNSQQLVGADLYGRSWHPISFKVKFDPISDKAVNPMSLIYSVDGCTGERVAICRAKAISLANQTTLSGTVPTGSCRCWRASRDATLPVLAIELINNDSSSIGYDASFLVETTALVAVDGAIPRVVPA
jgi:hypothetical protein